MRKISSMAFNRNGCPRNMQTTHENIVSYNLVALCKCNAKTGITAFNRNGSPNNMQTTRENIVSYNPVAREFLFYFYLYDPRRKFVTLA